MADTSEDLKVNKEAEAKLQAKREQAERDRREQLKNHRVLGAFLGFYLWLPMPLKIVFQIFGLLYSPVMVQNLFNCLRAPSSGQLRVISGPEYIYFYLMGIWGLIFSLISMALPEDSSVGAGLAWAYLGLCVFTFVTVGMDFKGGAWLGLAVLLFGIFAVVGWYGATNKVPILEVVAPFFTTLKIERFPHEFVLALSILMLAIYLIVWIRMNLVSVLKIEGNYVQVWTFAARSPKDTRASFSIVPDYDDINEALLGFGCRLNLRSKSSRVQSHEFPNMPGGPVVEHVATYLLNAQVVEFADDDHFIDDAGEGDDE